MKIYKKYRIALFIDDLITLVVSGTLYAITLFLLKLHPAITVALTITSAVVLTIILPLIFKNSSPGMKIMGLEILDTQHKCPPPKLILYRQLNITQFFRAYLSIYIEGGDIDDPSLEIMGTSIYEVKKNT